MPAGEDRNEFKGMLEVARATEICPPTPPVEFVKPTVNRASTNAAARIDDFIWFPDLTLALEKLSIASVDDHWPKVLRFMS